MASYGLLTVWAPTLTDNSTPANSKGEESSGLNINILRMVRIFRVIRVLNKFERMQRVVLAMTCRWV